MSINLSKERLKTGEVLALKYGQTMVEGDIIVPDVKPDVKKVLSVSGEVCVKQRLVQQDRVYVQGAVKLTILYLPDGEVIGKIKSITTSQEFNHSIDVSGATPDMQIMAEAEPESFDFSLINSRKVNVRCVLGIGVKVTRPVELEIATGTEDGDSIQTQCEKMLVCNSTDSVPCQVVLREQLELPSGKPTIGEILKISVIPCSQELQMLEGKAVAKGQVKVCVLYGAEDEEGSVQYMEHMIPFTEIFDVAGAEEDMDGEVDYTVGEVYTEVREDTDGEARCLGIEILLDAMVKGSETREIAAISDAYALDGDVEIIREGYNIEQLIDNLTAQLSHKDSVEIPEMMPRITQVCDVNANAKVNKIVIENGSIVVHGSVTTTILYLSDDDMTPVASFAHTSDFTHSLDSGRVGPDCACDAKVWVDHVSYNLNGSDEMELRFVICINLKVVKSGKTELVTEIRPVEMSAQTACPSIVIYFVQPGDTLWNIAKRYHTTVDAIKQMNGLESDKLSIGQQIKICSTRCKTA